MKKQTFELTKMVLTAMSEEEIACVDGGGFWRWLGALVDGVAGFLIAETAGILMKPLLTSL